MKVIMGMIQAIFGLIFVGFVALFVIISIGVIAVQEAIDWFKKINNECDEAIKEYYKGLEEKDNE